MSLLLDARKKSQQAQSAQWNGHVSQTPALSLEEHPNPTVPGAETKPPTPPLENARSAGQNLFAAKSPPSPAGLALPNRNLLFALGGTILLLTAGAGYFWYLDSASNPQQLRPINPPPAAPLAPPQPSPAATSSAPPKSLVPEIAATAATDTAGNAQKAPPAGKPVLNEVERLMANGKTATAPVRGKGASAARQPPKADPEQRPDSDPIRIEQQSTELLDPLLRDAYLAYSSGKPDEAQQLYLAAFKKDAHNSDALLGLAAIAQQRGESQAAAQYYARVLVLDPRNAIANAGMSALTADDNSESRLKALLREQGNSGALHFALGNLYAEQSRWGEAQQAYFNAYTLEPGNAGFAFNLAVSLDHLGQRKLAAQHYQRALQLDRLNNAGFDHAQIEQRMQEVTR